MTTATGSISSCDAGQTFALQFTCSGTNCDLLNDFPGVTCTSDGATLTCTNGVSCLNGNFTTTFSVSQPLNAIVTSMQMFLSDGCVQYDISNNGTQSGIGVNSVAMPNCIPGSSSSITSSSSLSSSFTASHSNSTASSSDTMTSLSTVSSGGTISSSIVYNSSSPASNTTPSTIASSSCTGTALLLSSGSPREASSTYTVETSTPYPSFTMPLTYSASPYSSRVTTTPAQAVGPSYSSERSTSAETYSTQYPAQPPASSSEAVGSSKVGVTYSASESSTPALVVTSGAATFRRVPGALGLICLVLVFFALFHTAAAAVDFSTSENTTSPRPSGPPPLPSLPPDTSSAALAAAPVPGELLIRAEGADPFGEALLEILEDWVANKIDSPELAESLFREIWFAICEHFAGAFLTTSVFAEIGNFVKAAQLAFDAIALPEGPAGWAAVFAFNVALNYAVGKLAPEVGGMAEAACGHDKPCTEHFEDDAENCGRCGNKCDSGVCENSSCVSKACTGETCETFTTCGPGGSCVCASTSEGTGFCVDGNTPCAGLQQCTLSTECPAGLICAVATCCDVSVCVGATNCGGFGTTATLLFRDLDLGMSFPHIGSRHGIVG